MKQVAAAVIIENGKLLLARRAPGEKLAGYWELPGGKLEPGETPQQCLERELLEELEMAATAGDVLARTLHHYEHGSFEMLAVSATRQSGYATSVHDEVRWVSREELPALQLAPADVGLIAALDWSDNAVRPTSAHPTTDASGGTMRIGALVRMHLAAIFSHCEMTDHAELDRLQDAAYSKRIFNTGHPFCADADAISPEQSKRYWTEVYFVRGQRLRVTSQWFEPSRGLFLAYLDSIGIPTDDLASGGASTAAIAINNTRARRPRYARSAHLNARYRGNAIGNAQNLVVRNILSNLGSESFSERDWLETKEHFGHRCAYCGAEGELVIEHAIPINRQSLGEHRLGNLIPSCAACNRSKRDMGFREFLEGDPEAIRRIEEYMDRKNYVPLEDNAQIRMVLDMAHAEVAELAARYISILNTMFTPESTAGRPSEHGATTENADLAGSDSTQVDPLT